MMRTVVVLAALIGLGALKLPIERNLAALHRQEHFHGVEFNLDLREKLGQLGFVAALSGFRAIVADALFIQAYSAWENTEWGRMLLLFRHITTLQPRVLLFWDTAAWHMAWNASVAAMNDRKQPRLALRVKAQREYFALGKDFLERGIENNPDRPDLYETTLAAFAGAVAGSGRPIVDGADGARAVAVALAVKEAAETGQTVRVAAAPVTSSGHRKTKE